MQVVGEGGREEYTYISRNIGAGLGPTSSTHAVKGNVEKSAYIYGCVEMIFPCQISRIKWLEEGGGSWIRLEAYGDIG